MTLQSSIELLTREHKTVAHTIDGPEFHTRAGLLEQLRDAVFGGMESTGGSSMKSKLPIRDAGSSIDRSWRPSGWNRLIRPPSQCATHRPPSTSVVIPSG